MSHTPTTQRVITCPFVVYETDFADNQRALARHPSNPTLHSLCSFVWGRQQR